MGYSTFFNGSLSFNKPVTEELKNYINKFSRVRHMERNNDKIKTTFPDWKDKCYKGNLGVDGSYFIGGKGFNGQDEDRSIVEYNYPPKGVPELWCQWIINDDGDLEWDMGEKFYNYVEWLNYLITHFFEPEGYILNGEIEFQGEDETDFGKIVVVDNKVDVQYGFHAMDLSDITTDDLITELESRGCAVS